MCAKLETQSYRTIQIELVDNWHPRWREVLDAIEYVGHRDRLHIDADGWLSARHNLLVMFQDDAIAAHLCFGVRLARDQHSQPLVEAHLESLATQPGYPADEAEPMLRTAAERRARALGCRRFVEI